MRRSKPRSVPGQIRRTKGDRAAVAGSDRGGPRCQRSSHRGAGRRGSRGVLIQAVESRLEGRPIAPAEGDRWTWRTGFVWALSDELGSGSGGHAVTVLERRERVKDATSSAFR